MSDSIPRLVFYLNVKFPLFKNTESVCKWMTRVINRKSAPFFLSCFDMFANEQPPDRQTRSTGGSQTSLMLATINETMMPYMTPCPDLEIIHQSETLLHHKQCPELLQEDAFSNGPPQLYIIDGA